MSTLSSKVRANNIAKEAKAKAKFEVKADSESVLIDEPMPESPPKLIRQVGVDKIAISKDNILFVSDTAITPNIKEQLKDYKNIYQYSRDLFTNRSCSDLLTEHDCTHLWVNLTNSFARQWLGKELLKNKNYFVVAVYRGDKRQKWLDDLKSFVDMKCKVSELKKVRSLTYGELLDNLESLEIHEPVSKLMSCLGLSGSKLSKKKDMR